jgi:hypothetical protein
MIRSQGTGEDLNSGYFANASIGCADKRIGVDTPGYRDKPGRDVDGHSSFSHLSIRDCADDLTRPVAVLTRLYNDHYLHNADSRTTCQSVREFADPAEGSS